MLLYRPVGLNELRLIYGADMRAYPPRLPEQPIFYPVLSEAYAAQIARDWNTKTEPFAGFVTRFSLDEGYLARFEPQRVGGKDHLELWVPAEELPKFNRHIESCIVVETGFFGGQFQGDIPEKFMLAGKSASQQLRALSEVVDYNGMDFICEIGANHRAVFLNFGYWLCCPPEVAGVSKDRRRAVLDAVRTAWEERESPPPLLRDARLAGSRGVSASL